MKNLFKLIYVVAAILLGTSLSFAQQASKKGRDYIIFPKGDTLFCKIKSPFLEGGKTRYKADGMKSAVAIDPDEIKEYYQAESNELYVSVMLPDDDEAQFLQVVENGPIRIYQFFKRGGSAGSFGSYSSAKLWYMSKNFGKLAQIKTNSFFTGMGTGPRKERENIFGELLKDKPEVYKKYEDSKKFSFDNIRSLVHLYNTGTWVEEWDD